MKQVLTTIMKPLLALALLLGITSYAPKHNGGIGLMSAQDAPIVYPIPDHTHKF